MGFPSGQKVWHGKAAGSAAGFDAKLQQGAGNKVANKVAGTCQQVPAVDVGPGCVAAAPTAVAAGSNIVKPVRSR